MRQNAGLCGCENHLTIFHTIPTFNDPKEGAFRKHCGKKEEMLLTSISSFSNNVFYSYQNKFLFYSDIYCPLQMLSNSTILRFCGLVKG